MTRATEDRDESLGELREQLDRIDDDLLDLLNQRVAAIKATSSAPFYVPEREPSTRCFSPSVRRR